MTAPRPAPTPAPENDGQIADTDRGVMVTVRVHVDDLRPEITSLSLRRYPINTPEIGGDAAEVTSVREALTIVGSWLEEFED